MRFPSSWVPPSGPGAGRKPKALTEKIAEGRTAEVMMEPAELEGVDVPPVKDFLKSPQKSGRELVAEEICCRDSDRPSGSAETSTA